MEYNYPQPVKKYFVFAVVSLALLLSSTANTSVSVAFSTITTSFDVSLVIASWVLSAFQLAATVAQPLAGKASDIFGRKPMFMICLTTFGVGSFLCAVQVSLH